jgi:hypothetical protein
MTHASSMFTLTPDLSPHVLSAPDATTVTSKEIDSYSTMPLQSHAFLPSIPAEHSVITLPCGTRFEEEEGLVKGEAKKIKVNRAGNLARVLRDRLAALTQTHFASLSN